MSQSLLQLPRSIALGAQVCVLITVLTGTDTSAQTGPPADCGANECMEAVFDVGVVYQPSAGQYGITELMIAVLNDDLATVDALLASGAEVNARDHQGATALIGSSVYGSRELVERLLAAGADPDLADNKGDTPLSIAIQYKRTPAALALLDHGADPNVYHDSNRPEYKKPVLVRAAVTGQAEVVRRLVDSGANVHDGGVEALNAALWKHHEDIAAILLETGLDINAPAYDVKKYRHMQNGERVLHTAAQEGLVTSTKLLLSHGADINGKNVRGQSALHFAVKNNHASVVTLLLDNGAVVSGSDLATALGAGNQAIARQLIGLVDLVSLDKSEFTSLISLADGLNDPEILDRLFEARKAHASALPVSQLLFARAETDECRIYLWDSRNNNEQLVFSGQGSCDGGFFVNRSEASLYVVESESVEIYSLDNPTVSPRSVQLPSALIDSNLTALKERMRTAYGENYGSWMKANIVQFGVLENGNLAFATHSTGPADGTYGYVYAQAGGAWRVVHQQDCHRFDACRFNQVLGHAIGERPGEMTIWHPNVRLNPHFKEKQETKVIYSEDVAWNGTVTFEIDGRRSQVLYNKAESGHCSGDCTYTAGMRLQLDDSEEKVLAPYAGNNAIVDRYALVATGNAGRSKLVDLGTGESVFGDLQIAGWIY